MATYPEFKSPLINVWQYLNRNLPFFKKALGILEEPVATTGFDPDCTSSCIKLPNCTANIGGTLYDIYKLQGIAIMEDPSAIYVRLLGSVTTSSPTVTVIKNSTNVQAFDGVFQDTHTSISTGSLVQDDTSGLVQPVSLMFVNTDNTITTLDEHFFYAIAADAAPFNCRVYVDLEFAVVKGSTVNYSTL